MSDRNIDIWKKEVNNEGSLTFIGMGVIQDMVVLITIYENKLLKNAIFPNTNLF